VTLPLDFQVELELGQMWHFCSKIRSMHTSLLISLYLPNCRYINEGYADQISAVVSGALDRLHSEADPPVKFDTEQKLWVYLHRQRLESDYNGTSLLYRACSKLNLVANLQRPT